MNKVFIVNPISGNGKSLELIDKIKKNQKNAQIIYTKDIQDASTKVNELKNSIVYSVGGDGTLNGVLNGIVDTSNILSIIPSGSGNDFYRALENKELITESDICRINDKYFINVACIGMDAAVAYNTTIMKERNIKPSKIYICSILYTFFNYKTEPLRFKLDREYNDKYIIATICNGGYYGGGFNINPKSDINDGKLEFYYVDNMSKLKMPALLSKMKNGNHLSSSLVHTSDIKNIIIEANNPVVCNYDGENMIDTKFDIGVTDKKVKIYNDRDLVKKLIKS